MGTLQFSEFKAYIKFQHGNNTEFSTPTDYYGIWFNLAYKELATRHKMTGIRKTFNFPQLNVSGTDTTADGTAYIDVPTDALAIQECYNTTNNAYLKWMPWREYIKKTDRSTAASESKPTKWHRRGSYIYLYPTPDATYTVTIYYRKVPASLSNDSDVTLLGTEWDQPLLSLATYKSFQWTGQYDKAKVVKGELDTQISDLLTIYGVEEKAQEAYMYLDESYNDYGY